MVNPATDHRQLTTDEEQKVIALDIGGSSIKSGVVARGGRLIGQPITTPVDSRADAATILETFARVIRRHLLAGRAVTLLGVAVGCPGPFDYQAGVSQIRGVAKYESIYGVNLRADLRERLGMPALAIVFRNDAEAAIVGEALYGAGRRYRRLIGVTLGTGLGSAFVVDGVSATGGTGVPPNGWLYCLPFRGALADDVFSTRGLLARLARPDASHTTIAELADSARAGNERVRAGFVAFGRDLAEFLTPFAREFGADAFLILGGIAGAIDLFGPALARSLPIPAAVGQLGVVAPLLGAAELLLTP